MPLTVKLQQGQRLRLNGVEIELLSERRIVVHTPCRVERTDKDGRVVHCTEKENAK